MEHWDQVVCPAEAVQAAGVVGVVAVAAADATVADPLHRCRFLPHGQAQAVVVCWRRRKYASSTLRVRCAPAAPRVCMRTLKTS